MMSRFDAATGTLTLSGTASVANYQAALFNTHFWPTPLSCTNEIVAAMKPYYAMRVVGGLLYLTGALIMVWNVWMTIVGRMRNEAPMSSPRYNPDADRPIAPAAAPAE